MSPLKATTLTLDETMLARANAVLRNGGGAKAVIEAAFRGVPMTNYGIGLALQAFDLIIVVQDGGRVPATGVYRSSNPTEGFESLSHRLDVSWGERPTRFIKRVAISGIEPPR